MIGSFWRNCDGGVITTELVLVASFVAAILLSGLGMLRSKLGHEFEELGNVVETARIRSVSKPIGDSQPLPQPGGIAIEGDFTSTDPTAQAPLRDVSDLARSN